MVKNKDLIISRCPPGSIEQDLNRLGGLLLLLVGFLLSPLCWWNDLVINLPLAYAFGYVCDLFVNGSLLPGAIAGYWLSNLGGILLMQVGGNRIFQQKTQPKSFRKILFSGIVSSSLFTATLLLLVHFQFIDLAGVLPL
ncbi:hypothetical protein H6G45_12340 [Synechocystis sp. FACHB-383]|uniref:hypothetical protein n=1 Tax=Synechocystis sp. FACHB-383 TaxID=2692864 RepID=UPI00168374E1|nr:hypothetical protein [Synechocystis sp. FACHB-383]MBD2654255.1 hypothetical protein [Synechocystis sp. FACHB-383]